MLLLKLVLLFWLREAVVIADISDQEEMLRCGGDCPHEQYLVCAFGSGKYRSFPNHCYKEAINRCNFDIFERPKTQTYSEVDDYYCNYHKDYTYFEVFTCKKALEQAKVKKANYFKNLNSVVTQLQLLLLNKDELLKVIDKQTYDLGNDLKKSLIKNNVNGNVTIYNPIVAIYQSNCIACTERKVFVYSECVNAEIDTPNSIVSSIGYVFGNITQVNTTNKVNFVSNLNKLKDVVDGFNSYFNNRLQNYSRLLISIREKSEKYIIPEVLYSTGNTLIKSFRIASENLNSSQCEKYLSRKLNQLSQFISEIITPYVQSKYLLSSLEVFLQKYGEGTENKSLTDLITSLEDTFLDVENTISYESSDVGVTAAYIRLSSVIGSLGKVVNQSADCLQSTIQGQNVLVYNLLQCLSTTNSGVVDISLVKTRVTQCYVEYKVQSYCLKYTPVTSSQDLIECISLTTATSDKNYKTCCFN